LLNEAYVGVWTFKKREWLKVPGTNDRRPRERNPEQVIRREYPERRIVDAEVWEQVRIRSTAVRARYTSKRSAGGAPGRVTNYPLSGLLFCGCCGSPMVITTGSSAAYYKCGDYKKRRTCSNSRGIKEELVRSRILAALQEKFSKPDALDYLRKRIAEHLGESNRDATRELAEVRARLARTEDRIAALIRFLADGDRSEYVVTALRDLEAQARSEKAAVAALAARGAAPIALPTPADVAARAADLKQLFEGEPPRAREALRRYFVDGRIVLTPTAEGAYVAERRFLPLVALSDPEMNSAPAEGRRVSRYIGGCAGAI
jgi:hypothetical protein